MARASVSHLNSQLRSVEAIGKSLGVLEVSSDILMNQRYQIYRYTSYPNYPTSCEAGLDGAAKATALNNERPCRDESCWYCTPGKDVWTILESAGLRRRTVLESKSCGAGRSFRKCHLRLLQIWKGRGLASVFDLVPPASMNLLEQIFRAFLGSCSSSVRNEGCRSGRKVGLRKAPLKSEAWSP